MVYGGKICRREIASINNTARTKIQRQLASVGRPDAA